MSERESWERLVSIEGLGEGEGLGGDGRVDVEKDEVGDSVGGSLFIDLFMYPSIYFCLSVPSCAHLSLNLSVVYPIFIIFFLSPRLSVYSSLLPFLFIHLNFIVFVYQYPWLCFLN